MSQYVIKATCSCGKAFWAKGNYAGKSVTCKSCKTPVSVSKDPSDLRIQFDCQFCGKMLTSKVRKQDSVTCTQCEKKTPFPSDFAPISEQTVTPTIAGSPLEKTAKLKKKDIEERQKEQEAKSIALPKKTLKTKTTRKLDLSEQTSSPKKKSEESVEPEIKVTKKIEEIPKKTSKMSREKTVQLRKKELEEKETAKETLTKKTKAVKEGATKKTPLEKKSKKINLEDKFADAYREQENSSKSKRTALKKKPTPDKTDVFPELQDDDIAIRGPEKTDVLSRLEETDVSLSIHPASADGTQIIEDFDETEAPSNPPVALSAPNSSTKSINRAGTRAHTRSIVFVAPGSIEEIGTAPTIYDPHLQKKMSPVTNLDLFLMLVPLVGVTVSLVYFLQHFHLRGRFLLVRNLIVTLLFSIAMLIPMWQKAKEIEMIQKCQIHLYKLGAAMELYTAFHKKMPNVSGRDFLLCIVKEGLLVKGEEYLIHCPYSSEYEEFVKSPPEDVQTIKDVGYLGRRNSAKDFMIENMKNSSWFIPVLADKKEPPDLHGNGVNVLFWDKHVECYDWKHSDLGGYYKIEGNFLEQLME